MNRMSSPSPAPTETISTLLAAEEEYPPPKAVAQAALQQDFQGEYRRSIDDPEGFWGEQAQRFHWERKWQRVLDWDGARHQWFVGGKLNVTVNALDRHAGGAGKNRVAYIWLGEDGSERVFTASRGCCSSPAPGTPATATMPGWSSRNRRSATTRPPPARSSPAGNGRPSASGPGTPPRLRRK
jgi:hypothetical protein